jgi:hypothetical protein
MREVNIGGLEMTVKISSWFTLEIRRGSVYLRLGRRDLHWSRMFGLVIGE